METSNTESSKGHTKCVTGNNTVLAPDMAREHSYKH